MIEKMRRLLLAVDYKNRFPMGRKVTVGEVAKAMKVSRSTAHRLMVKACGFGFVEAESFMRGKKTCYTFKVSSEGNMFLNSQPTLQGIFE